MSVFAAIGRENWVAENELAFAIRDRYPVAPGHTLIITKRVVPTWFDASTAEQRAIFDLVDVVKAELDVSHSPDAYNVGFNTGAAAGQTVDHLHVHVIPRYAGDMDDPRGGVRHVIPSKGNYLADPPAAEPAPAAIAAPARQQPDSNDLVTTDGRRMLLELLRCFTNPEFNRIDLLVSFVKRSGLKHLLHDLDRAIANGAHIRLLTTNYLAITDARALRLLHDRMTISGTQHNTGSLEVRVFSDPSTSFHPKAYLFTSDDMGDRVGFVGSSNLSDSALTSGVEWNLRTTNTEALTVEFERLWKDRRATPLTLEWLAEYEHLQVERATNTHIASPDSDIVDDETPEEPPSPRGVQPAVLDALKATRAGGHKAGLVVMATGLGKTWLAAFDVAQVQPKRVLFVAHRKEILAQARDVFAQVLPSMSASMWVDDSRDFRGDIVFASVAGLRRLRDELSPDASDYIVVDEFHHASAPSYRRFINHFRPQFLLGLTATPERADGADLLALCADNLVADVDLRTGIDQGLLVPFQYRGIPDVADYAHLPWRSRRFDLDQLTASLATDARARQVFGEWSGAGGSKRRALGFCCTVRHAEFMADYFRSRGVEAAAVHSDAATSAPRSTSLERLRSGDLPIIFAVDLFNEGVDVPDIDLVMFLRPTESPVVFFQQLGRGLRTAPGKSHLDVIDLVANHDVARTKIRLLGELARIDTLDPTDIVDALRRTDTLDLPAGCDIVLDLELLDNLARFFGPKPKRERAILALERRAAIAPDHRPTALEVSLSTREAHQFKAIGGWFGFLHQQGLLTDDEQRVWERHREFLVHVEHGAYTRSYKIVTLQVLIGADALATGLPLEALADTALWLMNRNPSLMADYGNAKTDPAGWLAHWKKNPVAAWTTPKAGQPAFFRVDGNTFRPTFSVEPDDAQVLSDMVSELVDYVQHRYLQRNAQP